VFTLYTVPCNAGYRDAAGASTVPIVQVACVRKTFT